MNKEAIKAIKAKKSIKYIIRSKQKATNLINFAEKWGK